MGERDRFRGRKVCVAGAGAMAEALSVVLAREGAELRLWARRSGRAAIMRNGVLAGARGCARRVRVEGDMRTAMLDVDCVLVCVSDTAAAEVARDLAEAARGRRRAGVALHAAGFLPPSVLRPLRRCGFAAGSLHPLVSLPPRSRSSGKGRVVGWRVLEGAWCRIEGDAKAQAFARRLVRAVQGRELRLRAGASRAAYHASAALLANGSVALFDAALEVLEGCASKPAHAREALFGLLASTTANLATHTAVTALSGPASRGDVDVVAGHLAALEKSDHGVPELYRELTRRMLALAHTRGSVDAEQRAAIERLL